MASSTGPDIVTDGLQVALDAGNEKSYSFGDTTWSDLSGNGYDYTFQQFVSPSFDSFYKLFLFDRNNSNIATLTGNNIAGNTNYSMMMTIVISDTMSGTDCRFFWHGNYAVLLYKAADDILRLYIRNSTSTALQIGTDISSYLSPAVGGNSTNWMCIAATYDGSTMKLYLNGELKDSRAQSGGFPNAAPDRIDIGGYSQNTSYYTTCFIRNVYIYNTTLSDSDVLNNYNSIKSSLTSVPNFPIIIAN